MNYVIEPNLSKKKAYQTTLAVIAQLRMIGAGVYMNQADAETFRGQPVIFLASDQLYANADFVIVLPLSAFTRRAFSPFSRHFSLIPVKFSLFSAKFTEICIQYLLF